MIELRSLMNFKPLKTNNIALHYTIINQLHFNAIGVNIDIRVSPDPFRCGSALGINKSEGPGASS